MTRSVEVRRRVLNAVGVIAWMALWLAVGYGLGVLIR